MPRAIAILAVALVVGTGRESGAGLIPNESFETVPSGATGQGILPTSWQAVTSSPDTYSNNGSYGLPPGGFGNFPGVTAFDGIRWVAGAAFGRLATTAVGGESFGILLPAALTPGVSYQLDAHLYQAIRADLDNPGGYDLFLNTGNSPAGALLIGTLGATTGVNAWEARSLTFTAPAGAATRPFLIFSPYQSGAGNSYPGIDLVVLQTSAAAAIPEPASAALFGCGCLAMVALRRRRSGALAAPR